MGQERNAREREIGAGSADSRTLPLLLDSLRLEGGASRLETDRSVASGELFIAMWHESSAHRCVLSDPERVTILFFVKGAAVSVEDEARSGTMPACAGDTALLAAGQECRWHCAGAMHYLAVSFPARCLELGRAVPTRGVTVGSDHELRRLGFVLADIVSRDARLDDDEAHAWATVLGRHVARRWTELREGDGSGGAASRAIKRVVALIADDLHASLSIRRLAAAAGMSRPTFLLTFKRALGRSPHRYVLERRIDRARQLLSSSDAALAEVARAVGFCSQSHFTNAFGRYVGSTPAAYRAVFRAGRDRVSRGERQHRF